MNRVSIQRNVTHCPRGRGAAYRRECLHGFTLVELMVTIAVAVILITVAVPGYRHLMASHRLTTTTNKLVQALTVARMEAISRGTETQFCSDKSSQNGSGTLGTKCGTQMGAVYALEDGKAVKVMSAIQEPAGDVKVLDGVTALRFTALGLAHEVGKTGPYEGTVAVVCSTYLESDNRRLIKMVTGSIIHTETETGSCS